MFEEQQRGQWGCSRFSWRWSRVSYDGWVKGCKDPSFTLRRWAVLGVWEWRWRQVQVLIVEGHNLVCISKFLPA